MQCIIWFVYFVWSQWHSQLYFEIDIPLKVSHFQILAVDFLIFGIKMTVFKQCFGLFQSLFHWTKALEVRKFRTTELRSSEEILWRQERLMKVNLWGGARVFPPIRSSFVIYCFVSTLNYTLSYTPLTTLTLNCVTTCRGRHHHLTEGVELAYEDN